MVADIPAKTDTVMVNRDIHFNQIASVLNMEVSQLKELNPQYRRNIINGSNKPSSLRLPSMLVNKFIDNEQAIYDYNADALLNKRAEVEVNEENIANTSYSRSNSYTRSSNNNSYRSSRHKNKHAKKHKERSQNVTIKDGDTLSEIAERNHTTVSKLKKLNKISGSNIRAGKKLRVK